MPASKSTASSLSPPEITAQVLLKLKQRRRGLPRREGHRGGHHRPGLLQRRPAPGHQGRRARLPGSTSVESSTSRRPPRSRTGSTRRRTRRSPSTTSAAAPSTSPSSRWASNVVEVIATNGDTHLGGDDIDQLIMDWLIAEFKKDTGIDVSKDKMVLQRLKEAAEKAKIELSSTMETDDQSALPDRRPERSEASQRQAHPGEVRGDDRPARRAQPRAVPQVPRRILASRPRTCDEVVLVGGSTRIPKVAATR